MAQQDWPHEMILQPASGMVEMGIWSQMEWFVKLAEVPGFDTMPGWEQHKWKEEFAAMQWRARSPVLPIPADTKRYPGGKDDEQAPLLLHLPTIEQMQEVRNDVSLHINELADGKGTFLGPFEISLSVSFHHVHDAYGRQGIPRHIIYRGEMGKPVVNMFLSRLLRHMTKLLETYCDQIRRCPRESCRRVFLQNRRHQEYCSRRCQSVAVMRKLRRPSSTPEQKRTPQKGSREAFAKEGSRHGKKKR